MKLMQPHTLNTALAWLAPACVFLFLGCEQKPRIGTNSSQWRTTSSGAKVHGIDYGSAFLGGYREGTAIIIWTDTLNCTFPIKATWDKDSTRAKYAGHIKSPTGPRTTVECYVADRMEGSISINDQEYDLADGSLFLISLRSSPIRVGQINLDIYEVAPPMSKARRQLTEKDPEIRAFFEGRDTENQ